MSDHALPPDPASWPKDPFRLLGVPRGVSARDLRRAYLHLIRSFKPEHAPEEFQRIRAAYEAALPFARERGPDRPPARPEPWPGPDPAPVAEAPRAVDRPPGGPDPWDLACGGDPTGAYRALLDREIRGGAGEEVYLRLYWLRALVPGLEPGRPPADWLIRGLGATGPGSRRLRELFRRELAADPGLALGDRPSAFLGPGTPPSVAVEVAEARWRAARRARRWSTIPSDLEALRAWLPGVDLGAWARALLAASANLAWAERPESDLAVAYAREFEQAGHRGDDHAEEGLHQLEYARIVKAGLDRIGDLAGFDNLHRLLALSWDEPGPESRSRLRAYVGEVDDDPEAALAFLDRVHREAPAVLGRLSTILGGLEPDSIRSRAPSASAELAPTIERFFAGRPWNDYRALRPALLRFCLREAASPGLVARTIAERTEFILAGQALLVPEIEGDWPLRHAYRATEVHRQPPDRRSLG